MSSNPIGAILVAASLFALDAPARAEQLEDLLAKGPVVSVETDSEGRFASATAVIRIDRPVEAVWAIASDLARHKDFVPKLLKSEARRVEPTASTPAGAQLLDVDFEIEAPGDNPDYRLRFELDPRRREMSGQWRRGDLKGSSCRWRLEDAGEGRTLLFYTTVTKNFSSLAAALEDDQQTLTVGVNVSSALTVVKAVKHRAEQGARP